jgi:hypothetical protein
MKIYKIKQMSGVEVVIVGKETLDAVVAAANKGTRLIVTKYGVINPASIDSITLHKEMMNDIAESMRYGASLEKATRECLPSPIDDEAPKLTAPKP